MTIVTPVRMTLIVCATARNGIGQGGRLPWRLPTDLAFFKHATTFVPASRTPARNVVVMGRKTWESIPARFRPLAGRINIVISRSTPRIYSSTDSNDTFLADSLPSACQLIQSLVLSGEAGPIFRSFLIGGGELYREALDKPKMDGIYELDRLMVTRIVEEGPIGLECDTFLPDFTTLQSPGGGRAWELCTPTELEQWLGKTEQELRRLGFSSVETLQDGPIRFVFQLWRETGSSPPPVAKKRE
ncbi:hypothetical protein CROQUDRAFT_40223 [Cronartium quercuum f. sp. fusiforme G11]|uniref:Dihydrofolate reductase n=1 Tax=Cronartium quercuum f. sp. fusiforme G11 TaxID=708437 RepID=A0A9P6NS21_9BASI|nr:hypothetical protein CROQUDRAFT_40223 [Cronartium quercuum f. sp. fusiforme G11]